MKRAPSIPRAGREAVLDAHKLSNAEARLVVASYYDAQEMRKRSDMQIRHLGDKEMPRILQYTADANAIIEGEVKKALLKYSEATPVGEWCLSHVGIGPVITAGLLAHLDIEKAPTAGQIFRFAGLDPSAKWRSSEYIRGVVKEKRKEFSNDREAILAICDALNTKPRHYLDGATMYDVKTQQKVEIYNPETGKINWKLATERLTKRPYNAALKQITYHMGECFKRTSGDDDSFYGRLYRERKELLVARNEAGHNAERAKTFTTRSAEVEKTLAQGKLPAGNLDRQACNFVAKIFLSHLHGIMFWDRFKKAPPKPFGIAILGHAHEIAIPNTDMFPGFAKAYYGRSFRRAAE
jgi:hypothetical protein